MRSMFIEDSIDGWDYGYESGGVITASLAIIGDFDAEDYNRTNCGDGVGDNQRDIVEENSLDDK